MAGADVPPAVDKAPSTPIEQKTLIEPTDQELKSIFPPTNTYTSLKENPTTTPELAKLRSGLKQIGLPDEAVEKIANAPQEHVPIAVKEKTLMDKIKIPGPLKGIGIGTLVILITNLWKGIQSFFGEH